ncbi:MAG: chloramphenicol phosphotransferase CPT family protein [Anaerolineae bacterium]
MTGIQKGKIIVINGASSAGKSTLATAVHQRLPVPFLRFSFDLFIDSDALPREQIQTGGVDWAEMRPRVFRGYHRCWPALAGAGNNLLIDHIIEEESWVADLTQLLAGYDVFMVGLHCSLEELERREIARGDRGKGDARRDLEVVHKYVTYDFKLDAQDDLESNAEALIEAWQTRKSPSAFDQLREKYD